MPRISETGRLVLASQPRASVQGTVMLSILTEPDSVRRRPMLSQLLAKRMWSGWAVATRVKMWSSVPSRTPSRTVRSETTPPVLKFLWPLKRMLGPEEVIWRSLSRGLTAPPMNWVEG